MYYSFLNMVYSMVQQMQANGQLVKHVPVYHKVV